MLTITGGTYLEFTREPRRADLFGSGGRAASALTALTDGVDFHTYIGKPEQIQLDVLAATLGFRAYASESPHTIAFHYVHGLSVPEIRPSPSTLSQLPPIHCHADHLLRFGMLEGDAVVSGGRVVYDPQSAFAPQPFAVNGSSADHLAIVANQREIAALAALASGENEQAPVLELASRVLASSGADVVVVKRGSAGAIVVTPKDVWSVPAVHTARVWPIGSGDVFAAIFTIFWAERGLDAVEAAVLASAHTAQYCASPVLPLRSTVNQLPVPKRVDLSEPPSVQAPAQVYLAGPFFTMAQRWIVDEIRNALTDQGLRVFSPFHDVGPGAAKDVAPADIRALDASQAVIAILDDLDPGTVFEVGYARAKGIPVVGFAQNVSDEDLKMLVGTDCVVLHDLVSAIYSTAWAARTW